MNTTIKECATDLEQAIRKSEEYIRLQEMYADVNSDEVAKKLFDDFRELQMVLQEKQMAGQRPTEEEVSALQNHAQVIQQNDKINKLLEGEQKIGILIDEINKVFMKPLGELYNDVPVI